MGPLHPTNSNRAAKPHPQAHQSRPKPTQSTTRGLHRGSVLRAIRNRLETVRAGVIAASGALLLQDADMDSDVALLLRRFVADELGRQIEALDAVLARSSS